MKKYFFADVFAMLTFALLNLSCYSIIYKASLPALNDGKYDSQFPYFDASEKLKEIGETVKLVSCMAVYDDYIFPEESNIKLSAVNKFVLRTKTVKVSQTEHTVAGSGTIIYSQPGKIALLTCAHLVDFPDTVVTYFADQKGIASPFVQSISIKIKQFNFVPELPGFGEVNILLSDSDIDLAILGKTIDKKSTAVFPVFNYPNGSAKELEWGSFIYSMGYPFNYKMLTSGIVSKSYKEKDGTFLINTVVNRGFSGGIVLGIRDGVPNFELVGIILSIISENKYYLKPKFSIDSIKYNINSRYLGDVYIGKLSEIRYGLTRVLPIETILDFLKNNKSILDSQGYNLDTFLYHQKEMN